MTYKKISKHTFIILIFALSMVILAVFRCSFLIRDTLTLEVQKNLKDVTAQNALTVTQELTDKFNLLNSLSNGITDVSNDSEEYIQYLKVSSVSGLSTDKALQRLQTDTGRTCLSGISIRTA